MRLFETAPDGGKNSGVTGFFLIEIKSLFSIVLLSFRPNTRENYHSHAFNALTWTLAGDGQEERLVPGGRKWRSYWPSIFPKYTPKHNIHKVHVARRLVALSIRGPWQDTWNEVTPAGKMITLTHGRKQVDARD